MEFLRFGSHIPGRYWGCCAATVIQNFRVDPDTKWSSQVQYGDMGTAVVDPVKQANVWVGPTYRDIFKARLRFGEFSGSDMPNHTFFAILTQSQIDNDPGKKWLAILKECGFEFLRVTDNSVYNGQSLAANQIDQSGSPHKNYHFALFRNIGQGRIADQFTPPQAWLDLPKVKPEAGDYLFNGDPGAFDSFSAEESAIKLTTAHSVADLGVWEALGPPQFHTEEEMVALGAPIVRLGRRDDVFPTANKPMLMPRTDEEQAQYDRTRAKKLEELGPTVPTVTTPSGEVVDPFAVDDTEADAVMEDQPDDGDDGEGLLDSDFTGNCGDPYCQICAPGSIKIVDQLTSID